MAQLVVFIPVCSTLVFIHFGYLIPKDYMNQLMNVQVGIPQANNPIIYK